MSKTYPLAVEVAHGELTIRIGVDTLAWAFNNRDDGSRLRVVDPVAFAKDVRRALSAEDESGQSVAGQMLDDAMDAAIDDGAQGVTR